MNVLEINYLAKNFNFGVTQSHSLLQEMFLITCLFLFLVPVKLLDLLPGQVGLVTSLLLVTMYTCLFMKLISYIQVSCTRVSACEATRSAAKSGWSCYQSTPSHKVYLSIYEAVPRYERCRAL